MSDSCWEEFNYLDRKHSRAAKQSPLKSQTLHEARESKWRLVHSQWGKPVADPRPSFIQRTKEGSNLKRQV